MTIGRRNIVLAFTLAFAHLLTSQPAEAVKKTTKPTIIAHRGASGYLPEHTLEGVAMAHNFGVDYVEPDVVLTKDSVPIVLHDVHLQGTTDVARVFPKRKRKDGHYYAIDFSLAEIRRLAVRERTKKGKMVYPERFPSDIQMFRVPTLEEYIRLVAGLNRSTGRTVGLYLEIKAPSFHRKENRDITKVVLQTLRKYDLDRRDSGNGAIPTIIQCFEAKTLKRLRGELKAQMPLAQLIGENSWGMNDVDYDAMKTDEGIAKIAKYADAVGFWIYHVLEDPGRGGLPRNTGRARKAAAKGLSVAVYTLRADKLPAFSSSIEDLADRLLGAGADSFFSDHADMLVRHYRSKLVQ